MMLANIIFTWKKKKLVSLDLCFILHKILIAIPTEQRVNDYYAAVQKSPYIFPKREQIFFPKRIRKRIWNKNIQK